MFRRPPVTDPVLARRLFNEPHYAWIWLVVRVYIGWAWLESGWQKVTDPRWVRTGDALKDFWERAVAMPQLSRPPATYDWYRSFLDALLQANAHTWFAKLVAYGEFIVGLALVMGLFTGIVAIMGAFMNMNFMLAGTAATNPVLFLLAVLLVMAWKTAGYIGLDYWVLPAVGTPWPGRKEPTTDGGGG